MKRIALLFLALLLVLACTGLQSPPPVYGVVHLDDYGGDLQAAINATPNGGTVVIPAGVWEVGDVAINQNQLWQKVVTLQGVAPGYFPSRAAKGNGEWQYLLDHGWGFGSVLRGHIDATATGSKLIMRDLAMIGDGTGTAVDVGNGTQFPQALDAENIFIGNYETGIHIQTAYYLNLSNITIAGIDTGLIVSDSNVVRLSDIDIATCQLGADLQGGTISFVDGSVQYCADGVIFGVSTGTIGNIYFEGISGNSINLTGNGNNIEPNWYGSGTLEISGDNNIVTLGINPDNPIVLAETASYNRVIGSAYLECDDSGFGNHCDKLWPVENGVKRK